MTSILFNREEFKHPADGWYQIEAKGEHPNASAGVIQIVDDQAAQGIVDSFNSDAAAGRLRHGNEMLIDHEHFSDQPDKETRAYGWLRELQNRADGIYGKIRWTATGQTAVDGGDYRFFSTEYNRADLKSVNSDSPQARYVRPTRLSGLTLTNMNNNRGQRAITNRENVGSSRAAALKAAGFESEAAWNAAGNENRAHVEANKAAAEQAAAQRKAQSEGEEMQFSHSAVERFCRAVKSIQEAGSKTGQQMISLPDAWVLAQQKFPEIYDAAFRSDAAADGATAVKEVKDLANRIGTLAGQNFQYGWQFVQRELPRVFNRLSANPERIQNRVWADRKATEQQAAKVFNRLVRAEMVANRLTDSQAWRRIETRHPALSALASGKISPYEALAADRGLSALLAE